MAGHWDPRSEDEDRCATTPAEAAAYVAELTAELALIARRHGFDALGYILDMATLEAENVKRFSNGRR